MLKFRALYQKLLLLYPEQYRKKYGVQIMQTMEDMIDSEPRTLRKIALWLKEVVVLPGNVLEEHMAVIAHRGGLTANALIGFISLFFLIPFLIAMIADEISERLYGEHLYDTWLWSKPMLKIWVIVLPLLSLFISIVTYSLLTLRASLRNGKITFQIKRLWLVIAAGLISSGILFVVAFHDSARCWIVGPNANTTWVNRAVQCTENYFLNSDKT